MPSHGFYPDDPKELAAMIKSFKDSGKNIKPITDAKACVLPHAGYVFSGAIAMHTLMKAGILKEKFFVAGPDHYGYGTNESPSQKEHSVDVQVPLIKAVKPNAKIKQLVIGEETDYEELLQMAERFANKETFFIASSDFIHYGPNYGYEPEGGIEWVKKTDEKLAGMICKLKAENFFETMEENAYTVCGYKPITLIMLIAKSLGAKSGIVVEHKNSYDVMPSSSFVDYLGIVFD